MEVDKNKSFISMNLDKHMWSLLTSKADSGDASAQNDVASWLEEGCEEEDFLLEKNMQQAAKWYLKSAEGGNAYAQDAISRLYSLGDGIELDVEKAIAWALKSIAQGNAMAAYNLGTIYRDQQQFEKAFEYYCMAWEMGEQSALLQIALCHYFGIGTTQNHQKANQLFDELLTKQGQVAPVEIDESYYWIGVSYLNGTGRDRSVGFARENFLKANRDEDHAPSMLMLNLIGRD